MCGFSVYYFILLIIQCYLLIPVIQRLRSGLAIGITAVTYIVHVSIFIYCSYYLYMKIPLVIYGAPFTLLGFYFVIGVVLGKSKRSYSLILPLVGIIIGTLLQLLETYWLNTHFGGGFGVKLSSIVYCTSVIVFLFSKKLDMAYNCAENILGRTIRYIGQLSFGIYLIHVYFLFVLLHFWPHPNFYLLWITVTLFSVGSVTLGKKVFGRYAEKYFGFR